MWMESHRIQITSISIWDRFFPLSLSLTRRGWLCLVFCQGRKLFFDTLFALRIRIFIRLLSEIFFNLSTKFRCFLVLYSQSTKNEEEEVRKQHQHVCMGVCVCVFVIRFRTRRRRRWRQRCITLKSAKCSWVINHHPKNSLFVNNAISHSFP